MSNELVAIYGTSGIQTNIYFVAFNASMQWWNGSAFENYNASNYSTYDIASTEQGATGNYVANTPSALAVRYEARRRSGAAGTELPGDSVIWEDKISTAQSGDAFARIGANGAGLTALASQTSVDNGFNSALQAIDAAIVDVLALPTAVQIANQTNTTLTASHGAGAWDAAGGSSPDVEITEQDVEITS